jgi:phenylpropionate dioxygenase-like ring-hydroxylating dioxygenase large terminal subunit
MNGRPKHLSIDPNIARAWTLPARLYFDPATFVEEREKIFARTWQVVGHALQVAKPGDYFTTEVAGEPLLFVRDNAGEVHGFYNVCRHRAGPPAEGCGSRKIFRCAYHGWTYNLEGQLLNAPEFEGVDGFSPEDFRLAPVRTEQWAGLIFVNLDSAAASLAQSLGDLTQQVARFGLEQMQLVERRTYSMKCNWKTYVDNYLEGYHLPSVHPALNRELDYGEYVVEPFARHIRQRSPIRGAQTGDPTPRRYQEAGDLSAEYFWIFPNWMLNCYPDNVSLNIVVPVDVERTVAVFEWYLPPESIGSRAATESVRFSDEIQIEDGAICEAVQRNLHSRSYDRGRFSVKQEKGVHAFHRMYVEAMG